uniref:Tetratricopeptide repeat protein 7 N-terminal domain-containing protein n=1 Tax=Photinus pyralis TaxID=7054 RepID=A0A1Y1K9A2_PHOPY
MTTRSTKYNAIKMDIDIEKYREEQNWLKVIQLAEHLKERSPNSEYLANFLIGEGKLEKYLEEWPPIEANIHRAKIGLMEAKQFLELASSSEGIKAEVALDSFLLLGKLYYACGQYTDSLNSFKSADLDALSEKKLPLRSLRTVAESFAIKALCNVKVSAGPSKFKKAEREVETLHYFEVASDLALLYAQEVEKQQYTSISSTGTHSPQPPAIHKTLSPILEQALHEAPLMLLRQGKPFAALERYRIILSAVEAQTVHTIRLKFLCQLAELILRGTVCDDYKPPTMTMKDSAWKPKQYSSLNQFVPRNECEESLLVLLVAEAMAVRHTVLSQSVEFKEARLNAYRDATFVYDLLTLATARWGQFALLQESFERAMKFSFEESHVWRQHALSLITTGRYVDALGIFKEHVFAMSI